MYIRSMQRLFKLKKMYKDENKVFSIVHNKSISRIFFWGGGIPKCAETSIMVQPTVNPLWRVPKRGEAWPPAPPNIPPPPTAVDCLPLPLSRFQINQSLTFAGYEKELPDAGYSIRMPCRIWPDYPAKSCQMPDIRPNFSSFNIVDLFIISVTDGGTELHTDVSLEVLSNLKNR